MKKRITPLRVAIAIALACAAYLAVRHLRGWRSEGYACKASSPALRVLFIGNSHTFVNDLPGMMCAFGKPMTVRSVVAPGWTLRQHIEAGTAKRAIEHETWDWVVLQEASSTAYDEPGNFLASARELDTIVRGAGAKTILYELWPRRTMNADAMHGNFTWVASQVNAPLVPAGPAWNELRAHHPEIELQAPDGNHARPEGTYLAACTFFVTFFHEPPHESVANLSPERARILEDVAWSIASR